jgi:hypothetical protein
LQIHLSEAGVSFISISSPPVVPSPRSEGDYLFGNEITGSSDSPHKRSEEEEEEEEEEEGYSLFIVELDTQGQGLSHFLMQQCFFLTSLMFFSTNRLARI